MPTLLIESFLDLDLSEYRPFFVPYPRALMNPSELDRLVDPLQHLKLCPDCNNAKVSAPQLCEGKKRPEHKDLWYEVVCSNVLL